MMPEPVGPGEQHARGTGVPQAALEARGIRKSFAGVEVLHGVDVTLRVGEIHALLGENGAGKSTFAKIVAGVHRPTAGSLTLHGETVDIASPLEAQRLGVTLIHQEPISFPHLSVAENLVLGRQRRRLFQHVDWRGIAAQARKLVEALGVDIDVTRPMAGLSIADQQMVEIARALAEDSRIIIMDEPTAPLTPREVDALFVIARRLREDGRTIVFISHRLEEVRALCDRVTVFRDGDLVETADTAAVADDDIIRMMIGRPLKELFRREADHRAGEIALEVEGLTLPGRFRDINFKVHRGEVLGFAGLVGAGRTDVARAVFGLSSDGLAGSIRLGGTEARFNSPAEAIARGLAYVPEDRAQAGIFATLPTQQNITAAAPEKIARHGVIRAAAERQIASETVERLDVRLASPRQPIGQLSGGNQQKAILGRWLLTEPDVLILDEPTRGIDIGVKAEFYRIIHRLAAEGRAIVLISSDLPELLAMSDRILVMCEGRITAEFARADANQEVIMHAAVPRAGAAGGDVAA